MFRIHCNKQIYFCYILNYFSLILLPLSLTRGRHTFFSDLYRHTGAIWHFQFSTITISFKVIYNLESVYVFLCEISCRIDIDTEISKKVQFLKERFLTSQFFYFLFLFCNAATSYLLKRMRKILSLYVARFDCDRERLQFGTPKTKHKHINYNTYSMCMMLQRLFHWINTLKSRFKDPQYWR